MDDVVLRRGFAALRRLRQQAEMSQMAARQGAEAQCELCQQAIPSEHPHLLEVETREIVCVCVPCSILFDKQEASLGKYRRIGARRLLLEGFALSGVHWAGLRLPVDIVFFLYNSLEERVVAYYPSPVGPTESLLKLSAWEEMVGRNPILRDMEPDVEALLVNRANGANQFFLAPIDDCYRLVSILRTQWRGLNGGQEVWAEINRFFDTLKAQATVVQS